jgi:protease-4
MRSFFKYTFASIIGTIISLLLVFFILMGIVGSIASLAEKEAVSVKDNTVLKIQLNKPIKEREPKDPFAEFNFGESGDQGIVGLDKILKTLKKAKDDEKIKGIYLNISGVSGGLAALEEVRIALLDFKSSGKFIYSYSETYSQASYYLASVSDKVFINPVGSLTFEGLRSEVTFFKNALDKLDVEVQIIRGRDNKYKSAVEPFMYSEMSPANKEQMSVLLNSIWDHMLTGIAKERNLSVAELQTYADKLVSSDLKEAKAKGLVDDLIYQDQFEDMLKEELGIEKAKKINYLSLGKYASTITRMPNKTKEKVAVIYAVGAIQSGEGNDETIGSDRIAAAIKKARLDSNIKAIVLRVNSPGGSALASEVMLREVILAKEVKPVIVSMGDLAASGGYYISCMADAIVAQENTITGSIGVYGMVPNTQGLMNNKLGVTFDGVQTAENAGSMTITRPMNAYQKEVVQRGVIEIYDTFLAHVAKGRNMTVAQVDSIAQGRVWTGTDALEIGLVDKIGTLDDAIALAVEKAGLEEYKRVNYPKMKDPFEEMMKAFGDQASAKVLEKELGNTYKYYQQLKEVQNMSGYQARLPYFISIY